MWRLGFVREFKIFFNNKSSWSLSFLFYVIILLSTPLALSDAQHVNSLALIIIWLTFILSGLQLSANIFTIDYHNGWYQQIFLHSPSPYGYFFYKMLATTLVFILPLVAITPLIAVAYALTWPQIGILCLSLVLASPALCFISGIFAALTVSNPQRTSLLNIMVLPLCVPIYILGVGSGQLVVLGVNPYPPIALLSALSIFAILIAPLLIMLSIRNSFEY